MPHTFFSRSHFTHSNSAASKIAARVVGVLFLLCVVASFGIGFGGGTSVGANTPLFSVATVHAADTKTYAIPIPCEGVKEVNGKLVQDCDLNDLMRLISNVISFFLLLSITISACIIAYCGWEILIENSSSSAISKAKERLVKVLWGFFFSLTAWLIVKLITSALLNDNSYFSIF